MPFATGIMQVHSTPLSLAAPAPVTENTRNPLLHDYATEIRVFETVPLPAVGATVAASPTGLKHIENFPEQYQDTCVRLLCEHRPDLDEAVKLKQCFHQMSSSTGQRCVEEFALTLESAREYACHQLSTAQTEGDKQSATATLKALKKLGQGYAQEMWRDKLEGYSCGVSKTTNKNVTHISKELLTLLRKQANGDHKFFGNRLATGLLTQEINAHLEKILNRCLTGDSKKQGLQMVKIACGDEIENARNMRIKNTPSLYVYAQDIILVASAAKYLRTLAPEPSQPASHPGPTLFDGPPRPLPLERDGPGSEGGGYTIPNRNDDDYKNKLRWKPPAREPLRLTPAARLTLVHPYSHYSRPIEVDLRQMTSDTTPLSNRRRPPLSIGFPVYPSLTQGAPEPASPPLPPMPDTPPVDYLPDASSPGNSPIQPPWKFTPEPIALNQHIKKPMVEAAPLRPLTPPPDPVVVFPQNLDEEPVLPVPQLEVSPPRLDMRDSDQTDPVPANIDDMGDKTARLIKGLSDATSVGGPILMVQSDVALLRTKVVKDGPPDFRRSYPMVRVQASVITSAGGLRQHRFASAGYAARPSNIFPFTN
ncbi:hypothetical protein [Glaciimonas sp. PCH181]|uniref:hypothetical protein n=1 Tax=Glaciimonas sp. PCH181 TaxID=2133943 RepID=UPI000D47BBFE|nr:hypothetical protein [Glaciimonas sp. PCH181]PUA19939.1 hypothetical protein C7W93_09065 [Glaciimonas sp. PCH181]